MPSTAIVSEQLRLRIDSNKYAEPGQSLDVRITGSAREAVEFERVLLRLIVMETVPGRHGPRVEDYPVVELVVDQSDVRLQRGQTLSYSCQIDVPPQTPPSVGSAQHSLTYELRAEVLSGFDLAVGTARRSLTIQCCRARSGGLPPAGHEQRTLARTFKSDLLFGIFPVGSQINCGIELDIPVYDGVPGLMLGDRVTGTLRVAARKAVPEAHLWYGVLVRGGGKTERQDLGGPVTVSLDENQTGSVSFSLPDRAPTSFQGRRLDYEWYLRVEVGDSSGSNHHREEFALTVLPRVQPRQQVSRRPSTPAMARTSTPTGVQGLALGSVQGLTLASGAQGLTLGARGLSSAGVQGLTSSAGVMGLTSSAAGQGLKLGAGSQALGLTAAPQGLTMSSGPRHLAHETTTATPPEGLAMEPPEPLEDRPEELQFEPIVAPAQAPEERPRFEPLQPAPPVKAPTRTVQPPRSIVQSAMAAQAPHEGPGLSPEVVQYLAKIVQSSPFFANLLPDELVRALSTPEALKGQLTPELRELLRQKLAQNPQVARVLPPHLVGAVAAAKGADEAQAVMSDALTSRLLQMLQEQPRVGVALKYVITNFPGFRKRLPSAVIDALPEGPGKIDLAALATLLNEFPELKKHIPAGVQAMLGSSQKKKK
ncbi:MAG: hypothetical protein AMXMBFR33_28960 [Candidatus Xenobia bacterium]